MRTETIVRKLFQFDELSEEAKEKARDWFRQGLYNDNFEFECVTDDAKSIAALMGIEIDKIYWSGFSSQGDGACFEGSYAYSLSSLKAIHKNAPEDETLHAIAKGLQEVQKRNFYKLTAKVKHTGRYYHKYSTDIDVEKGEGYENILADDVETVKELLRDFMHWIYRQLEAQNDYINSNESIDENIRANEYEFTENGKRA